MTQKKSLNKYSLAAEDALRAKAVQTKTVTETDSKMMKKKMIRIKKTTLTRQRLR